MSIPFNQEELPPHLGYFTVTGNFLNVLAQVPDPGTYTDSGIFRTNLEANPRALPGGSMAAYGSRFSWVRSFTPSPTGLGASGVVVGLDTIARFTSTEAGPLLYRGVDAYGDIDVTSPPALGVWGDSPEVSSGDTLTFSRHIRLGVLRGTLGGADWQDATWSVNIRFRDSSGAWVSTVRTSSTVDTFENGWVRVSWTGTVPAGAVRFSASVRTTSSPAFTTSHFIDTTGVQVEKAPKGTYFDGGVPSTLLYRNMWGGTTTNPISIQQIWTHHPSEARINMRPISGTVVFRPSINSPITDKVTNLTLVPTSITAHIDPNGRLIAPGDGKDSIPQVYEPYIRLLAPNQENLSNKSWRWDIEVIPSDGSYWMGFKLSIGPEARPGDMITLNEALVVDRDVTLRPERVFPVENVNLPYPFGFDPERDSLLIIPELTYWRVTA